MANPYRKVDYGGGPILVEAAGVGGSIHLLRMSFTGFEATDLYCHLYDSATAEAVTPGTNIKETFHLGQNRMTPLPLTGNLDTEFRQGLVYDVTDDVAGTGNAPTADMIVNGRYQ